MTGKKKGARHGGSREDDRALWEFVAASVEPERSKNRVPEVETPDLDRALLSSGPQRKAPVARGHAVEPTPATATQRQQRRVAPPPDPQPVALQRKRARRVARGAEEIEARLDLHGMTQDDAHYALAGFIARCHAQGLRFVLVITGKGGAGSRSDDDGSFISRPRGVLRRNVPRWLGAPELSPMVVSYTTAHIRHGGEGALYVQLRAKR